ncbi:unnamed protein product [Enterobius vermicularis]|uniref:Uncharacterized protein n=1 Tax=Enterobius vermicularis TaxID=51028 RepID=A0A0N4V2V0_ENTVE|nr:unnamed protein product [Enterobius vermicularis]
MDNCNGSSETQFVCLPVNLQHIGWLLFGIFLIVITCCSSLVACYVCQMITRNTRHTDHVVFYKCRPKYSRSLPYRLDELPRDDSVHNYRNPEEAYSSRCRY